MSTGSFNFSEAGVTAEDLSKSDFSKAKIRWIAMARAYRCSTTVDWSPSFPQGLMNLGEQRATEFRTRGEL